MHAPKEVHCKATKIILRYIQGTTEFGFFYARNVDMKLTGYSDADWVGSMDHRKYTTGYLSNLGSEPITWASKKKHPRGKVRRRCASHEARQGKSVASHK
jgi:hypothetical protein